MKFEPWTIAYQKLGKKLERIYPQFQELHIQLKKGGVLIAFKAYIAFMVLTSIIAFIIAFPVSFMVLPLLMKIPYLSAMNFVFSLAIAAVAAMATLMVMYLYPGMKASNRNGPIDRNLPYLANFLTLLSSSNVPPSVIFESVAKIDTLKESRLEFSNIIRDIEIFGSDLMTSILDNAKLTPNDPLRELLIGYVATVRTGGNPTEYLKVTSEKITQQRMTKLDANAGIAIGNGRNIHHATSSGSPAFLSSLRHIRHDRQRRSCRHEHGNTSLSNGLPWNPDTGRNTNRYNVIIREMITMKMTKKTIKRIQIISAIAAVIFFVAALIFYLTSPTLDYMMVIAIAIGVVPPSIGQMIHNRWRIKIEKATPEFLRDLATASRTGIPLQIALEHASKRMYGPLTDELKILVAHMSWGMGFNEALTEFADRLELPLIKRATVLINEAGKHGGDLADIFNSHRKIPR